MTKRSDSERSRARSVQGQRIADQLRTQILDGDLVPGSRLGQELLAERFGASRMPVREALRTLESEGLVRIKVHSGAWVSGLDLQEFEQCYKLREAIEPVVIVESMANLGLAEIDEAARLATAIEQTGGPDGLRVFMRLDREFHLLTYSGASYPLLTELVDRLWNMTQPYRRELVRQMSAEAFSATCAEHALIVDALRRRDTTAAAGLVRLHIQRTQRALAEYGNVEWERHAYSSRPADREPTREQS